MNILQDHSANNKYSKKARSVWRELRGLGLAFDFLSDPKEGLQEALQELKAEGKIFEFRLEKTKTYYYVMFEIQEDEADETDNGDFVAVLNIAKKIDEFF